MKRAIIILTLLAQNIVLADSSLHILESEITSKKVISPTDTVFRSRIVAKILSQQYSSDLSKEHYKNIVNSENVNYIYGKTNKSQNNFSDLFEEQFVILGPNVLSTNVIQSKLNGDMLSQELEITVSNNKNAKIANDIENVHNNEYLPFSGKTTDMGKDEVASTLNISDKRSIRESRRAQLQKILDKVTAPENFETSISEPVYYKQSASGEQLFKVLVTWKYSMKPEYEYALKQEMKHYCKPAGWNMFKVTSSPKSPSNSSFGYMGRKIIPTLGKEGGESELPYSNISKYVDLYEAENLDCTAFPTATTVSFNMSISKEYLFNKHIQNGMSDGSSFSYAFSDSYEVEREKSILKREKNVNPKELERRAKETMFNDMLVSPFNNLVQTKELYKQLIVFPGGFVSKLTFYMGYIVTYDSLKKLGSLSYTTTNKVISESGKFFTLRNYSSKDEDFISVKKAQ